MRGAARGGLLSDLRRLLAGEARLANLLEGSLTGEERLRALRLLEGEEGRPVAGCDGRTLREREALLLADEDPVRRLSQRGSVALEVARELHASLGDGAEAFLSASWRSAPLCLRANVARIGREELAQRLTQEDLATRAGAWSPWALHLEDARPLPRTRVFDEGLFEVQDEASQLVARLVDPPRSAPCVDACAGAGGKTLALCALLGTRGRVVAIDPHKKRLEELRRRAARAQAFNLLVQAAPRAEEPLSRPLAEVEGRAARVLVDAPCSGLGALRRKPDVARRIDATLLARLPDEQFEIARAALRWLRPDGRLIYATCTPLTIENEAVVTRLCATEGLVPLPCREWLPSELRSLTGDDSSSALRLLPSLHGTDAFTVHVLRRSR